MYNELPILFILLHFYNSKLNYNTLLLFQFFKKLFKDLKFFMTFKIFKSIFYCKDAIWKLSCVFI